MSAIVKHQPATTLPFTDIAPEIKGVVDQHYRYIVGGAGFHSPSHREPGFQLSGWLDPRDAAYIAHAANAYPKLVAALREVVGNPETQDTIGGVPLLNVKLSHEQTVQLIDLLREFGEAQ